MQAKKQGGRRGTVKRALSLQFLRFAASSNLGTNRRIFTLLVIDRTSNEASIRKITPFYFLVFHLVGFTTVPKNLLYETSMKKPSNLLLQFQFASMFIRNNLDLHDIYRNLKILRFSPQKTRQRKSAGISNLCEFRADQSFPSIQ